MKHPDYPGVSSMTDRHGKQRWRFRRGGHKDIMLPGEPHTPEFDAAWQAVIECQPLPHKGQVIRLSAAALPETFKAAYVLLRKSQDWKDLDDRTRERDCRHIEKFLGYSDGLGDCRVADLRRKHVRSYLATMADTPHAARVALKSIRKLVMTAIEEEWLDTDPTWQMKYNPPRNGWPAWTADMMDAFERHWPVGSPPRTAYALGLWLGNRASDVARHYRRI
jgi:hypothetical protein